MVVGSRRGLWPSPTSAMVRFSVGRVPVAVRVMPCATLRIRSSVQFSIRPLVCFLPGSFEEAATAAGMLWGASLLLGSIRRIQALVNEPCIDRVDDLLRQRCLGKALLVAAGAPVVLQVTVMPPEFGLVPISRVLQHRDRFVLGLGVKKCEAKVPNLAVRHCLQPPVNGTVHHNLNSTDSFPPVVDMRAFKASTSLLKARIILATSESSN